MKSKERNEIIKVLEDLRKYLENHMTDVIFLCKMERYLTKKEEYTRHALKCGYNDRMIPAAIAYLQSEQPTNVKNVKIYNGVYFVKGAYTASPWWRYNATSENYINLHIGINHEKIDFLNHLILKLKK